MTTPRPVSDDEYGDLLATSRSLFRLDTTDRSASGEEHAEFTRWLQGVPRMPDQIGWWKQYLDQVAAQAQAGRTRRRVRVLADPPTAYQRWLLWATPWAEAAGEEIRYLPVRKALEVGLPDADWWLLDDRRAVILAFDDDGRVEQRTLVTEPALIARYRIWRDLAVRFSVPAAQVAAA